MKSHTTVYLKDYSPYPFTLDTVNLRFELDPKQTTVTSCLHFQRNPAAPDRQAPLILNGEELIIRSLQLDGRQLTEGGYTYDGRILSIASLPDSFELCVTTEISPENNTALEGLYRSSGNYYTQCEAEGFRRITCFPDRPDVMAVFTTTIIGQAKSCPVLLSNGNCVEKGKLANGRHFATWHDPFPKPCYLFALVAGDLVCIADTFTTMSGRKIDLHIFVEHRNRDKCGHAMQSLKKAMRWDETTFGREYDLDTYMIVAVDDFNMGAMENKGLNIFNSKYVLARPETATDTDYEGIEGVIAHEYFHNWTGNRITCRDWFQLSLKEGLTVFRDQEFSADQGSRAVKRIHDVNVMRSFQFREDSGPMAHPVRPASFVEINNFYTLTVYNKGAEVIRMIHTLLGNEGFRRGMDLYFERHDGQAVTCDDFIAAMEDANSVDLSQFTNWYSQAGTPEVTCSQQYNQTTREYSLTLQQSCPLTPDQSDKKPFLIPVSMGLLDKDGLDIPLQPKEPQKQVGHVLLLKSSQQTFTFAGITKQPVLSLLRNFSAPVKLKTDLCDQDLAFLMAHDSDSFNRWDAGQQLALKYMLEHIGKFNDTEVPRVPAQFHHAFQQILTDTESDPAFRATAMELPNETWINQQLDIINPDAVFFVRQRFRFQLSVKNRDLLHANYQRLATDSPYRFTSKDAGNRALKNCCLQYLLCPEPGKKVDNDLLSLGIEQYKHANNMTDAMAALAAVVNADREAGDALLSDFYKKWQQDPLVVDKWFILQATCSLPGTLDRVQELTGHTAFSLKNPNKVRSLIGAFCSNQQQFHAIDGKGYAFLANVITQLDRMNPQVASRMLTPLTMWRRYDSTRTQLMRQALQEIASRDDLSRDVGEIVEKSLK